MSAFDFKLDADNSWLCQHDNGAPPTRLRLDQTQPWPHKQPTAAPRRWIDCPDCGTHWRVWVRERTARVAVEWNVPGHPSPPLRYKRSPVLDIDRVIEAVHPQLPHVHVTQHAGTFPGDDEGVWFFRLARVHHEIQLESSAGQCPFSIEHDEMKNSAQAWKATTVDDAVRQVIDYFHVFQHAESK